MINQTLTKMSSFLVMDILERAQELEKQGKNVIHLEVGEPDFCPPSAVKEAMAKAIADNFTSYTHSQGILELREALVDYYQVNYGVDLEPDQFFITQGTSPALLMVLNLLLNPEEEVILTDPCYACYPNFVLAAQGRIKTIPIYPEQNYWIDPDHLSNLVGPKTKAMLLNSPANPTGTILPKQNLEEIANLAYEKNFFLISDEIYHGLVYQDKANSLLEITKECFVLNGFSKLFAMTGLRLGFLISPLKFVPILRKMAQNFFICANSIAQKGALAALKCQREIQEMVNTFAQRRIFLLKGLKELGFTLKVIPQGAFYVFCPAHHLTQKFNNSSLLLAKDILEKTGVGLTPGIDFGPRGEGFLRFSYANSLDNIQEGLDRLANYINTWT